MFLSTKFNDSYFKRYREQSNCEYFSSIIIIPVFTEPQTTYINFIGKYYLPLCSWLPLNAMKGNQVATFWKKKACNEPHNKIHYVLGHLSNQYWSYITKDQQQNVSKHIYKVTTLHGALMFHI